MVAGVVENKRENKPKGEKEPALIAGGRCTGRATRRVTSPEPALTLKRVETDADYQGGLGGGVQISAYLDYFGFLQIGGGCALFKGFSCSGFARYFSYRGI